MASLRERPPLRPSCRRRPWKDVGYNLNRTKFLKVSAIPVICTIESNNMPDVGLVQKLPSDPPTGQIDCEKAALSHSPSLFPFLTHSPFRLIPDRQGLFRPRRDGDALLVKRSARVPHRVE